MIIVDANFINDKQIQRALRQLGPYSDKVLKDSYSRAANGMRTDATRLIVKTSGLKRAFVFKSFSLIKSSNQARVFIKGRPIPLYLYGVNPKGVMKGRTKGGVSVKFDGKRERFRHAFITQFKSGHIGIFERQRGVRTSTGKIAIKEFFHLSVPQYAGRNEISEPVMQNANERFMKRFQQQADRYFRKMGVR